MFLAEPISKPKVLITGAAGGLARVVVNQLVDDYELVGVDPRPFPSAREFPGEFHQVDYVKRKMADIFRNHSFHALLHLGRVPVTAKARQSVRYNINVLGTRNLLELALKFHVKTVIVFSTFHVYGAHQHNHLQMTEEDPLRASQIFAELSDAVELDNVSSMFLLKNRDQVRTVILRPVNVIGPEIQNQVAKLLRAAYCPVLMGYDPMMQFIHEYDIARALVLSLQGDKMGVYNVAGEGLIPWTDAVRIAGATPVPIPHFLAYPFFAAVSKLGVNFPKHLLDYFRYPTIVTDAAFREDMGYEPKMTTIDALRSIRNG
ncbi:NAD-dependent epimerase/dehydratase family protein [Bdellovibrionota bacterium FG-1]